MRTYLLTCLLLIALPAAAVAAPAEPPATQPTEHLVLEPVFQGQAYILEAGRGNSPGVLLVHGLGDEASESWSDLIAQLARSCHVVAVDLPGFGKSEKQNKLYSPSAYAAFLKWVVDRYLPEPLVVIGHSLGGAVAIKYAATYPRGVENLIVADVAGILHRRAYTRELVEPGLRKRSPELPAFLPEIDKVVGNILAEMPELPGGLDRVIENRFMRRTILGGSPAKIAALALIEEDFSRDLRRIEVPCLVLWGAEDTVAPLRTGLLLEAVLPNASLQLIAGAGHVPMRDRPELFNRAVADAIAGSSPRATAPAETRHMVGTCTDQDGMTFTGKFDRLEISGCRDVTLKNVTCGRVDIRRSGVVFEQGLLKSDETALSVTDSSIKATGTRIEARRAIVASRSQLDLAGVELVAKSAAVTTSDRVPIIFSVSRVKSPHTDGYIHGAVYVTEENPL